MFPGGSERSRAIKSSYITERQEIKYTECYNRKRLRVAIAAVDCFKDSSSYFRAIVVDQREQAGLFALWRQNAGSRECGLGLFMTIVDLATGLGKERKNGKICIANGDPSNEPTPD